MSSLEILYIGPLIILGPPYWHGSPLLWWVPLIPSEPKIAIRSIFIFLKAQPFLGCDKDLLTIDAASGVRIEFFFSNYIFYFRRLFSKMKATKIHWPATTTAMNYCWWLHFSLMIFLRVANKLHHKLTCVKESKWISGVNEQLDGQNFAVKCVEAGIFFLQTFCGF